MQTVHFAKRFTSGNLTGITVNQTITASPETITRFRVGRTGSDVLTNDKWIITSATVTPAENTNECTFQSAYIAWKAAKAAYIAFCDDAWNNYSEQAHADAYNAYTVYCQACDRLSDAGMAAKAYILACDRLSDTRMAAKA